MRAMCSIGKCASAAHVAHASSGSAVRLGPLTLHWDALDVRRSRRVPGGEGGDLCAASLAPWLTVMERRVRSRVVRVENHDERAARGRAPHPCRVREPRDSRASAI